MKLYKLSASYVSPILGPEYTINPSWLLSMSDHDVSLGYLSVSTSNITSAFKVVGSTDMDGLTEGDWDRIVGGELGMLDGIDDGITEVLGENVVKSVSQM